ncbi:MAG: ankyrin repeat domain-containing protein [Gemmatimonadetes bacterium]|nr:ankyrin repeat domain-containing protein [Gemmatimonadota bacterium]
MLATREGHVEAVGLLVEKGADVNARTSGGFTASMWAKREGHQEVIDLLEAASATE